MKEKRLQTIREILSSQQVGSQEELLRILLEKGYSVTQATLSRDMRELQVLKRPNRNGSGYTYILENLSETASKADSRQQILSLEFSGQLAVAKTRPANAAPVAAEIDAMALPEILGTIAGDDTIVIILRQEAPREKVKKALTFMK